MQGNCRTKIWKKWFKASFLKPLINFITIGTSLYSQYIICLINWCLIEMRKINDDVLLFTFRFFNIFKGMLNTENIWSLWHREAPNEHGMPVLVAILNCSAELIYIVRWKYDNSITKFLSKLAYFICIFVY